MSTAPRPRSRASTKKQAIGFMLVHGGLHDSRCWSRVMPHLAAPASAVDLPGRGSRPADLTRLTIDDFVESAVADLDAFDDAEKVVLVGHSMAGLTLPGVAARRPERVSHLVFVSCIIPREGGSMETEMSPPGRLVSRLFFRKPVLKPQPRMAKYMFCNTMNDEETAFTMSILIPETNMVMSLPVSRRDLPSHDVIPRTYVKLLRDKSVSPKAQDRNISNLGECDVRTIDAGHDVMISDPRELARTLNDIAGI